MFKPFENLNKALEENEKAAKRLITKADECTVQCSFHYNRFKRLLDRATLKHG